MLLIFVVLFIGPVLIACSGAIKFGQDWRTADRSTTGIGPNPASVTEAVVQVYSARAFNWRGVFAVHTWVATKPADAAGFTIHHVVGWRARQNLPVVVSEYDLPDRSWYGNQPKILVDVRGETAQALIPKILQAVNSYPYEDDYTLWPGPNSNTFTAYVARQVPELKLDLPPTAIGKDFLVNGGLFGTAPSGSGYQISLAGFEVTPR